MKEHKGFYTRDKKPKDHEIVELDVTHEQYFLLNEEARAKEITLDEHVSNILQEVIKNNSLEDTQSI